MAKQEPKKKPETVTPEEETAETAAAEVTETEQKLQELENNLKDGNRDAAPEDYQKGIDMIFKQFQDILTKLGVESFGEKGDVFDPNLHSAVMHTEEEGEPENAISEVFSKGYKLGDKILRPAVVKVVN